MTGNGQAATYNKTELFLVNVIALVTGGMVFSIRADILLDLQTVFFDPVSKLHAAEMIGAAAGAAFLGLAIANFVGGPLCDFIGMGRLLGLAALFQIAGASIIIWAHPISSAIHSIYWSLWLGMLCAGLAHGLTEGVINPLVATLYPNDKTHKLNVLHAWWPGGIIIGGVIALVLTRLGLS